METNNNLHQHAVDMMTWRLLYDLNFKNILNKVNVDQVHNVIYRFLQKKIEDKELSVADIEEIRDNIMEKSRILFDKIGDDWNRGDDGCHDIATAAVAFGKQNYEKCLKNHDYLVSMREATKEYENVLYPFNDIIKKKTKNKNLKHGKQFKIKSTKISNS